MATQMCCTNSAAQLLVVTRLGIALGQDLVWCKMAWRLPHWWHAPLLQPHHPTSLAIAAYSPSAHAKEQREQRYTTSMHTGPQCKITMQGAW